MTNNTSALAPTTAIARRPVKLVEHPTFRRWRALSVSRTPTPAAVGLASLGGGRFAGDCNPTSSSLFAS
jgi:hypothetical protein